MEQLRAEGAAEREVRFTLAVSEYGDRHVELRIVRTSPAKGS